MAVAIDCTISVSAPRPSSAGKTFWAATLPPTDPTRPTARPKKKKFFVSGRQTAESRRLCADTLESGQQVGVRVLFFGRRFAWFGADNRRMSLRALPTALVAARIFPLLDFASWCRLARVDSRHGAIARTVPAATPIEFAITEDMPLAALHRPNLRPRAVRIDHHRGPAGAALGEEIALCGPEGFHGGIRALTLWAPTDPLLWLCGARLIALTLDAVDVNDWHRVTHVCRALERVELQLFFLPEDPFTECPVNLGPPPPSLRSLRIMTSNVPPAAIAALATHCPRLETLDVPCSQYAASVADLAFPNLTRLALGKVEGDVDAVAIRLASHRMPRLTHLTLADMPDGVAIQRLRAAFPRLEALDMRRWLPDARNQKKRALRAMQTTATTEAVGGAQGSPPSPSSAQLSTASSPALWSATLRSVAARDMATVVREYPFASLTELHLLEWRGEFDLPLRSLPRLRHLVLSRYSPPSAPWSAGTGTRRTWRDWWRTLVDPIVEVAPGLQTLEVHCTEHRLGKVALGLPDARGELRCVDVPALVRCLRSPSPHVNDGGDGGSVDDTNAGALVPCRTLTSERAIAAFSSSLSRVPQLGHRLPVPTTA
jgi:hypothetical protein